MSDDEAAVSFRAELEKLQKRTGLSDAALEKAAATGSNYLGRMKRKKLPIPDRATVLALGKALQDAGASTAPEELWALAAQEKTDPEAREWYEARLAAMLESQRATGEPLSEEVAFLVRHIQSMQELADLHFDRLAEEWPGMPRSSLDVASALRRMLESVTEQAASAEDFERESTERLWLLLRAISELPGPLREDLIRAWIEVARTVWSAFMAAPPKRPTNPEAP